MCCKITIVTVVYNDAKNIANTINTVITQSFQDYEYIIVDGKSTDGTVDVINRLLNNRINVTVISEPDKGIYDAMNKSLRFAKGKWICFMNSGDTFYAKDTLLEVSSHLSDECEVVYGNTNMITEYGFVIDYAKEPSYLLQNMPFCHQCSFVKTDLLRSNPFNLSFRYVADYNFFYSSYVEGHRFKKIDITIATYNTIEGFSASNKMKVLKEVLRVRKSTDNFIRIIKSYSIYYRYVFLEIIKIFFPSFVRRIRYKEL